MASSSCFCFNNPQNKKSWRSKKPHEKKHLLPEKPANRNVNQEFKWHRPNITETWLGVCIDLHTLTFLQLPQLWLHFLTSGYKSAIINGQVIYYVDTSWYFSWIFAMTLVIFHWPENRTFGDTLLSTIPVKSQGHYAQKREPLHNWGYPTYNCNTAHQSVRACKTNPWSC